MDIAKIRKKFKETKAGIQQSQDNSQTTKGQEDQGIKPDERSGARETLPDSHQEQPDKELSTVEVNYEQEPESADKEKKKGQEEKTKASKVEEKSETEKTEEVIEILTFSLLNEDFAFRISQLEEILRYQWITTVPNVPKYILGVTSLRGTVIPVIDLKLKLSLTDKLSGNNRSGKILIIKGPKGPIGVAVDKVLGVVRIATSEILPPPSHLSETELKSIEGIAIVDKRFVSIINMEEAISLRLK